MSYILDALQRADQERNIGEVPKLDMALQPGAAAAQRRSWLPTALLIVFLASLVATGLWMLQNGYLRLGAPASQSERPVDEQAATTAPPQTTAREVEKPKPRTEPTTTASRQPASTQATPATESAPQAAAPESAPARERPEPKVAEPKSEPPPRSETRSTRMPTPNVAPAPPPSWVRQEEAERFRQENTPDEPVQSYLGLPQSFRNSMGKLEMNAHVFSTNPGRSFVLINGKRYRIGDYLAEGPEVTDILPDGVVLKHRGETFLLSVQR